MVWNLQQTVPITTTGMIMSGLNIGVNDSSEKYLLRFNINASNILHLRVNNKISSVTIHRNSIISGEVKWFLQASNTNDHYDLEADYLISLSKTGDGLNLLYYITLLRYRLDLSDITSQTIGNLATLMPARYVVGTITQIELFSGAIGGAGNPVFYSGEVKLYKRTL